MPAGAVFWDWDGTLSDSKPLLRMAWDHTCDALKRERITEQEFLWIISENASNTLPKFFPDNMDEAGQILYKYVTDRHIENFTLIDGAGELLERLAKDNIPMAIISHKREPLLIKEVGHANWNDHFFFIRGRQLDNPKQITKPAPEAFMELYEQLPVSVPIEDVYIVGDGLNDVKLAKNAGAKSVGFGPDFLKHGLTGDDAPDFYAQTMDDLEKILCA